LGVKTLGCWIFFVEFPHRDVQNMLGVLLMPPLLPYIS
jgi:hypothetical protein